MVSLLVYHNTSRISIFITEKEGFFMKNKEKTIICSLAAAVCALLFFLTRWLVLLLPILGFTAGCILFYRRFLRDERRK